ncbi:ribosomal protein S18-alanine N-acetyltransferase [Tropicimonas marinistellae]|uniref:ribosomal protein S18-alanine N-acetyltransferase n=1 Tax=Tropicimonas marinistellae TaxID=1739787 RepID=UPI000837A016|nr:ribosomal protein S18-alanine N-acetyltransferase [Tropicimonas marinistellae]
MTPEALAALHHRCFETPRPWSAAEFSGLLEGSGVFLTADEDNRGFALGRVIIDEVELLTLAVAPTARRQGIGRRLLAAFERDAASRGARLAILEVSAANAPAIALYGATGYRQTGRRPGYYRAQNGSCEDALIYCKALS